ncbi:hypothetical protein LTR86_006366 [Recurvomyces mirabilis]|nr:hypothetical protein LTR86_006366 [Recurvomyces mirabilis]
MLLKTSKNQLRNRIWKLVLGGQLFHVGTHMNSNGRVIRAVCVARHDSARGPGRQRHDETVSQGANESYVEHERCMKESRPGFYQDHLIAKLNVQVLLVCRQIYEEAALLPLQENVFDVQMEVLDRFVRKLAPAQAQSIRTLHLSILLHFPMRWPHPAESTWSFFEQRLTSIRSLALRARPSSSKH